MTRDAQTFPATTPLIIGHRGASALAPENTLVAFERALADGADGVEFDVRLARDRVPVVIHDATLRRTLLRDGLVADLTSSELQRASAGLWFIHKHPDTADHEFARAYVPTLDETLQLVGPRSAAVYIEMKCEAPSEYAALAASVVAHVRSHGLVERAVVKCFAHDAIREVKRLAPEVRTAALFDRTLSRPHITRRKIIALAAACGADEISLHRSLARPTVVEAALRHGFAVVTWTVDDPGWLTRARGWGLRAVITNDPARMRVALEEG